MSRTIMLVEDNPYDEALTLRALKKHKIQNQVVVLRDGQEALDYLFAEGAHKGRDVADVPQVMLLDINLPKVDGLEVLRRVRANAKTALIPIVILTSSREVRDLEVGYSRGANSYVRKPVDFNEFSEAVQQLGQYWLVLNETPPAR